MGSMHYVTSQTDISQHKMEMDISSHGRDAREGVNEKMKRPMSLMGQELSKQREQRSRKH